MESYSVRELAKLAIWYDTTGSIAQTQRNFRTEFQGTCPQDTWKIPDSRLSQKVLGKRNCVEDLKKVEDLKHKIVAACASIEQEIIDRALV